MSGVILNEWEKKRLDFPLQSYDDAIYLITRALEDHPNVTQKGIADEIGSSQSEISNWLGSEHDLRVCLTSRIIIYLNNAIKDEIPGERVLEKAKMRSTDVN